MSIKSCRNTSQSNAYVHTHIHALTTYTHTCYAQFNRIVKVNLLMNNQSQYNTQSCIHKVTHAQKCLHTHSLTLEVRIVTRLQLSDGMADGLAECVQLHLVQLLVSFNMSPHRVSGFVQINWIFKLFKLFTELVHTVQTILKLSEVFL